MLDIIALILLARDIGRLAKKKGLRASTWQIYLVAGWILAEIIGIFVGLMLFEMSNMISVGLVGIAFAVSSYFILRSMLDKYPDHWENEVDNIGNNP